MGYHDLSRCTLNDAERVEEAHRIVAMERKMGQWKSKLWAIESYENGQWSWCVQPGNGQLRAFSKKSVAVSVAKEIRRFQRIELKQPIKLRVTEIAPIRRAAIKPLPYLGHIA